MSKEKEKEETIEPEFDPVWLTPDAWDEDDDADFGQAEDETKRDADPS